MESTIIFLTVCPSPINGLGMHSQVLFVHNCVKLIHNISTLMVTVSSVNDSDQKCRSSLA